MNSFNLTEVTRLAPELRLERYHQLGYDIEVQRNTDWDGETVTIILEAKREGYRREITFWSVRDADLWNRGDDSVKPKDVKTTKLTLAFVVEPVVSKHRAPKEEIESRTVEGPRRVIEV